MTQPDPELLTSLLRDVSRSFYLTLRVLPGAIRRQIGLAYLLARTTDTIADTELVAVANRLEALRRLSERIQGGTGGLDLTKFATERTTAESNKKNAEQILLQRVEEALQVLASFDEVDRQLIQKVLLTIVGGQELDLVRFAGANANKIMALQTDAELDDYTYRVAGCVGEFWTRICQAHLFAKANVDEETFLRNAIRFGKGLQLVNILRDIAGDLRMGRCYIPETRLSEIGLTPADLLSPGAEKKFRPLYNEYLDLAEAHLAAGWEYTLAVPARFARVRWACAWPLLIGARTVAELREGNVLEKRIKIRRREVKGIILKTVVLYPFQGIWRGLFGRMLGAKSS